MRGEKRSELPLSLCSLRPNTNYICAAVLMELSDLTSLCVFEEHCAGYEVQRQCVPDQTKMPQGF